MVDVDRERLNSDIGDAFADVLGRHERSMPSRWVVLCEVFDSDGARDVWTFTADDATPWDTDGLLTYALHVEQALVIRNINDDEE